jgi:predicted transcriptional regulator
MYLLADVLELRIGSILKILSDPTRRKIIDLISQIPQNPQTLADTLNISRPAVEKHLKLMLSNYFCERSVEPFPSPHYVYYISDPGLDLLNAISTATILFFQSMNGIVKAEIEQMERDFILQRISGNEYESRSKVLKQKREELAELQLTRLWVEEAKQLLADHEKKPEE